MCAATVKCKAQLDSVKLSFVQFTICAIIIVQFSHCSIWFCCNNLEPFSFVEGRCDREGEAGVSSCIICIFSKVFSCVHQMRTICPRATSHLEIFSSLYKAGNTQISRFLQAQHCLVAKL